MKLARRPEAVLFDLDGILLDTEPLYTQAIAALVSTFGKEYTWELKARSMGTHARSSAALVIESLHLPLDVDEYLARRELLLEPLFRNAPAMPGARELVLALGARQVPMAVATSSERRLWELKGSSHPWLQGFPVVLCGDDPELENLKPAPDIYLLAAQRLGVPPAACLVFEDSPAGVRAGKAAGMQVVCVKDPKLDPGLVAMADLVVGGYAELTLADCGWS